MLIFAGILSGILVLAALVQWYFAWLFQRHFPGRPALRWPNQAADIGHDAVQTPESIKKTAVETDFLISAPAVAVVICIRGNDPSLKNCLLGALNQNYPNYELHLVIDDPADGEGAVAGEVANWIESLRQQSGSSVPLHQHRLVVRYDRCSLKCNALLNAWDRIYAANQYEYLLLLDADTRPPENWIRDLIGPLAADRQIGLVSGAQWFEPTADCHWGALVRCTWNAGALVPTVVFHNPWAGSLAMRVADVRRGKIPEVWQRSIVDDGPLGNALGRLGLRRHFAPSLILVNQENCSLRFAIQWMTRMLLWSRLYERNYFLSVVHSLFSTTSMSLLFGIFAWGIVQRQWLVAGITATGLIVSGILSVAALMMVRRVVEHSHQYRGESLPGISWRRWWGLFWSVPVTQWIYLYACLRALFARRISWRGVDYRVTSRDNIRILDVSAIPQAAGDRDLSI
jgi:glycosyltransferase involved in cell wall biosynthesis